MVGDQQMEDHRKEEREKKKKKQPLMVWAVKGQSPILRDRLLPPPQLKMAVISTAKRDLLPTQERKG